MLHRKLTWGKREVWGKTSAKVIPSREARPPGRAVGTVKQNAHGAHGRVTQPLAILTQGRPRGGAKG